jgi:hypothetical protein
MIFFAIAVTQRANPQVRTEPAEDGSLHEVYNPFDRWRKTGAEQSIDAGVTSRGHCANLPETLCRTLEHRRPPATNR